MHQVQLVKFKMSVIITKARQTETINVAIHISLKILFIFMFALTDSGDSSLSTGIEIVTARLANCVTTFPMAILVSEN